MIGLEGIENFSEEALALLAVFVRGHRQGYEWLTLREIEPALGLELADLDGRQQCRIMLVSFDMNGIVEERYSKGEFRLLDPEAAQRGLARLGLETAWQAPAQRRRPSALAERVACASV